MRRTRSERSSDSDGEINALDDFSDEEVEVNEDKPFEEDLKEVVAITMEELSKSFTIDAFLHGESPLPLRVSPRRGRSLERAKALYPFARQPVGFVVKKIQK